MKAAFSCHLSDKRKLRVCDIAEHREGVFSACFLHPIEEVCEALVIIDGEVEGIEAGALFFGFLLDFLV